MSSSCNENRFIREKRADGNPKGFGEIIAGRAVLVDGVLYFTGGASLYAVSAADGKRLWRYQTVNFSSDNFPAVANGVVYFGGGSDDRSMYALALG